LLKQRYPHYRFLRYGERTAVACHYSPSLDCDLVTPLIRY
jgi:hypothetical protein